MKKFILKLLFVLPVLVFAGCSNDDDDDKTPIVAKKLNSLNGANLTYADNLLMKIENEEIIVTFDYSLQSNSSIGQNVKMTIEDNVDPEDDCTIDMKLNAKGYVESCVKTDIEGKTDTWELEYNENDQLVKLMRLEGEKEVTVAKYENGNITEVFMSSDEANENLLAKIFYTTNEISSPIVNANNIMLFDLTLGIDMEEIEYAYWAGLLGKATKHLPLKIVYYEDSEEEFTQTFQWTITDNYVQKMVMTDSTELLELTFTWK